MSNCPCENCVCVAVCRNKQYTQLIADCILVEEYLVHPLYVFKNRRNGRLKLIQKALDPTFWELFYDEYGRAMVDSYTGFKKCHLHY
jgi:hypothetical protein